MLARAVGVSGAGVVSIVRPFALDFPLRPVIESHRRNVEGPGTLIAIFLTRGVVPSAVTGIGASLREFMSAHIGYSGKTLRLACHGRLRIATRVSIHPPKEGELNRSRPAGAVAVVSAVSGMAARYVCVHGIITLRGWAGNYFADLR